MKHLLHTIVCLSLLLLAFGPIHQTVQADTSTAKGREWAILIGAENYYSAPNLMFTVNDVKQLAKTLQQHGGYSESRILNMTDTEKTERFQPLKKSIMAELPRWLAKPDSEDLVLVYFSGHGFRDPKDGKLYLAPLDCDPEDPASTGISVQWLREQLAECKANVKLLILDACHAGGEKGDEESQGVSAKELGASFEDVLGVVTLASSTVNEKSLIWGEMKQSLFSFWLNQGLKGHADRDGNSKITIDELYEFVHKNVKNTAAAIFGRSQQPVRIVRSKTLGVPVVVKLKPYTLKGTLENVAEQLATTIRLKGLKRVGIAQFSASTTDPKLSTILQNGPCLLGRQCAQELEKRLNRKKEDTFEVVAHDSLHKALGEEDLSAADLKTCAIKGITVEGKDLPVVAMGQFCARTGRIVTLQCQLIDPEEQEVVGSAGGTALLNPSEWAMLGRSVAISSEDLPAPRPGRPPVAAAMVEEMDHRSEGPHPLLDSEFPFRVKIMVDKKERKPVFKGNDMFVPLSNGETYSIKVKSDLPTPVFMRILVDGLNTLPEKVHDKGIAIESTEAKYLPAQRVNLSEARAWIIEPEKASEVELGGFLIEMEEVKDRRGKVKNKAKLKEFKVTDAPQSLAAQQGFTEQIGIITVAFYKPAPKKSKGARGGKLGTTFGEDYNQQLDSYTGNMAPGDLLGVVHIRYVSPETLK